MVGADGADSCPPGTGLTLGTLAALAALGSGWSPRCAVQVCLKVQTRKIFRKRSFKKAGITGLRLKILIF